MALPLVRIKRPRVTVLSTVLLSLGALLLVFEASTLARFVRRSSRLWHHSSSAKLTTTSIGDHGKSNSPYAYVYMMWEAEPGNYDKYGGYLANVVISAKLFRRYGSKADILFMVKTKEATTNIGGNHTVARLPARDEKLLRDYGVKLRYLPHPGRGLDGMMHKFYIYNLTEYRRVHYLDSDVMPLSNFDYLMELSDRGVLEPTVVLATGMEPANGGFFIVEPSRRDFEDICTFMENSYPQISRTWNPYYGMGHVITPPDQWESNSRVAKQRRGTNWTFLAAKGDQGFLYHYPKYVKKRLTNILGNKVITFGEVKNTSPNATSNKRVGFVRVHPVSSAKASPFANYSTAPYFPNLKHSACTRHSGTRYCAPPYQDFIHFTIHKPWKNKIAPKSFPNVNFVWERDVWWSTLAEILQETNLTLMDFGLRPPAG